MNAVRRIFCRGPAIVMVIPLESRQSHLVDNFTISTQLNSQGQNISLCARQTFGVWRWGRGSNCNKTLPKSCVVLTQPQPCSFFPFWIHCECQRRSHAALSLAPGCFAPLSRLLLTLSIPLGFFFFFFLGRHRSSSSSRRSSCGGAEITLNFVLTLLIKDH